MAEPLGSPFLLRFADHDVDFAARAVLAGAIDAFIADTAGAARLAALADRSPATLVVEPGHHEELEEHWAAQRDATVLCAPAVRLGASLSDLDGLRRTAELTDGRPILVPVIATVASLGDSALPALLRGSGADVAALTVVDADWQFALSTQLRALLSAVASFAAAGVPLVVQHAERLGPGLVAAGAAAFTDALPHARHDPLGGGPPRAVGYVEPGTWREVSAFSPHRGAVAACGRFGCRPLADDRTRGDLREHRAHLAVDEGLRAEADPDAVIASLRGAGSAYLRDWGEAVATARRAAA